VKRAKRPADNPLIACLKKAGCTFCPECYAYMPPEHRIHMPLAADWNVSRFQPVGGYGNVGMVDTVTGDVVTVTTLPLQVSDDVLAGVPA